MWVVGWGGGWVRLNLVKEVSESNICIVYGLSRFKRSDEVKGGNTELGNFFRRTAVAVQVPTRRIVFFLTNDWLEVSGHTFNTQELVARLQMLDLKVASRSVERTAVFSGQVNVIQLERLPLRVKVVRTNSCSYVVGQYSSWQHWSSSHLLSIGIAEIPTSSLVLFGRTLLPDCYPYYYLMM